MIHKLSFYFINKFHKSLLNNLEKNIHIIYRNYDKSYNIDELLKIKKICKQSGRKFYLSNNYKLAVNLDLDGVYIPSFNKKLLPKALFKKSFQILGSAHNLKEILVKQKQNVEYLFLSPIFKIKKRNYFLGATKYNILANQFKKKTIALGGINKENIKTIDKINCFGFASISYIEKHYINGKRDY
ncbi:MAG: thiamine phosphate synthase [Candidatus Pelagibacter sp. TMED286]|jgi:thiamine-phosphate pyrophosphorylase|nr:MAG: thiamine phosphate synthase [Candidatus Pelagibacter sp. TMED286]|tara:strand:- start:1821 stop:2375 length:555 start_codon:yes stop_codon:yes gene_type:complete